MLKGGDGLAEGGTFVLRMYGHASGKSGTVTSALFELPDAGDRLLFALGQNPDSTYGSGPEGLLDISDTFVTYADGVPFPAQTSPEELLQDLRDLSPSPSIARQVPGQIDANPSSPKGELTEENFAALLTVKDVTSLMNSNQSLSSEIRDGKVMAASMDASQVVNIESWYSLTFEATKPSRGMRFTVIDFDSHSAALAQYDEVVEDGSGLETMVSPIGDASASVDVNAEGVGGMVVFLSGDKLVMIYTIGSGDSPLIEFSAIETLANTVLSRL